MKHEAITKLDDIVVILVLEGGKNDCCLLCCVLDELWQAFGKWLSVPVIQAQWYVSANYLSEAILFDGDDCIITPNF